MEKTAKRSLSVKFQRFWNRISVAFTSLEKASFKLRSVLVVPLALVLPCLHLSVALADDSYVRGGVGVFSLDLSESSPFIRTNGSEEAIGFLDHYNASDRSGAMVTFAAGGKIDTAGGSLFAEFSSFYTSYNSKHVHEYSENPEPWADVRSAFEQQHCQNVDFEDCLGEDTEPFLVAMIKNHPEVRSVGWIGRIDGGAMRFGAPNFAWGDPIRISTKRDVEFYGADLVFRSPGGQTDTFFFIGPSYKRLEQETHTFAYESNRAPEVNNMTLDEVLKGSYYGAVAGAHIVLPLKGRWSVALDGRAGLYHLDTDYGGSQRTRLTSSSEPVNEETRLDTDDWKIATTASVRVSLDFVVHEGLILQLGAGAEYLSDAPKMRYAEFGESFASGDSHNPARIEYSSAYGYFGTFSIVVGL